MKMSLVVQVVKSLTALDSKLSVGFVSMIAIDCALNHICQLAKNSNQKIALEVVHLNLSLYCHCMAESLHSHSTHVSGAAVSSLLA